MTALKQAILLLTSHLFLAATFGQAKHNLFTIYSDKVNFIISDSTFNKVAISHELYGSLTGYFRQDSVYLIVEHYSQEYGISECLFLFDKNELIFVHKKQISNKNSDTIHNSRLSNNGNLFEGLYLFLNNKIVEEKVAGEYIMPAVDAPDPYPFKINAEEYFLFLAKKNKKVLLQKRRGS